MPDGPKLKVEDLIRDGNFDGQSNPLFYSFVAEIDGYFGSHGNFEGSIKISNISGNQSDIRSVFSRTQLGKARLF
jgi:hypothetical protein